MRDAQPPASRSEGVTGAPHGGSPSAGWSLSAALRLCFLDEFLELVCELNTWGWQSLSRPSWAHEEWNSSQKFVHQIQPPGPEQVSGPPGVTGFGGDSQGQTPLPQSDLGLVSHS